MTAVTLRDRAPNGRRFAMLALALALAAAQPALAQNAAVPEIRVLQATPIGALPPMAMPMPASRNHTYWGLRLQAGQVGARTGPDLSAIAGGVDLQWRGGSVFGITGGYQKPHCEGPEPDCEGHALFGARARLNVMSGGPTLAESFGDYSATTTLGMEVGLGYAPGLLPDRDACTLDLAVPLSLAMLQSVRLVAFIAPGLVWGIRCGGESHATRRSYLTNLGIGVQQLVHPGLDLHLGLQRIFRAGTGYQFGISVSYIRLP
ncbi:MAG: hypothetical protein ACRELD_03320 [Longimicrobiales bacterium]